jgi:tape measure domain-containing protein
MANTASQGTTLKQVTAALAQLNTYANLTVYNFGEMAKNIGTFTAAGVDLNTSVSAIKGIANLAALSGSTSDQASTAMYQLSQAIAAGTVKLQDWNSVVNAGLGGKVFQNALIETARASGVSIDAIIKKAGSFRNSLQQGWLSSKILTETLSTFTGDLSVQQLKALGFTQKEAIAIQKQGQVALQSATQIRTVTQLTQALKEEVATAWSKVWEAIIGNSGQAVSTLSAFHNAAESALTSPIYALAKILQQFTDLGGRAAAIKGIENAFHALSTILSTVGAAFKEIFPSNGGQASNGLVNAAKAFERFTAAMTPSKQTLAELKTIFAGVFSVIKIGIDVIAGIVGAFKQVGGASSGASTGVLGLVAKLFGAITAFQHFIESGNGIVKVFKVIGQVLAFPIKLLGSLTSGLKSTGDAAKSATNFLQPFFQKVGAALSGFGKIVENALASGNLNNILTLVNQGIFATILLAIRKWFKGLGDAAPKKGLFDTIKESFDQLTGTLKTMQANLKSDILLKIAAAVGILTVSMIALSFINPAALGKALAAIAGVFTALLAATAVLVKISASGGIIKMVAISAALNLLATAVLILSAAVAILAQFSWEQLGKGLGAIAIILLEFATFAALTGGGKGLIGTAIAMNAIAVAINILSIAVGNIGKLDLATLGKGIGSIAAILLIFAGFNAISGKQSIASAAALVVIGAALLVIGQAMAQLGSLSLSTIGKALAAIAGSLLLIVVAVNLMPPTMILSALGLLAIAEALVIISNALSNLGGLSWSEIGKSLVELAGALGLIVAALFLMEGALPGAAALVVVAGALAILTPILVVLGSLSWEAIGKGLAALAGVFVVLGLAGVLLTPLVPTLLGLGLAITLLGVGVLAAGVGLALFAVGVGALAVSLTVLATSIGVFVSQIAGLVPLLAKEVGLAIIAIATTIATGVPAIVGAIVAVMTALLTAIIKLVPLLVQAFTTLITGILQAITKNAGPIVNAMANVIIAVLGALTAKVPRFVSAGVSFVIAIINGIGANLNRVVSAATNVVITFINSIGSNTLRISQAGINMIINLINGIANQINASTGRLRAAGLNLADAIINGMTFGLFNGVGSVVSAAESLASSIPSRILHILHIASPSKVMIGIGENVGEGLAVGLGNSTGGVLDSASALGNAAVTGMQAALSAVGDLVDANLTNLQPTITPVLDLSQAKTGFAALTSLTKNQLLNVGSPLAKATSISADNAAAAAALAQATPGNGPTLSYTQNNYSPVALSTAEIYRQTRNQISTVKGALPTSANKG